jgi:hypothetical protein
MFATAMLVSVTAALAILKMPFPGWDVVKEKSTDIIVARCVNIPTSDFRGWVESDVQIVCVLKGATNTGPARLQSTYRPRPEEHYLIFSIFHDGFHQATEEYRIIPIGINFATNSIIGRPLDEQLRLLFQRRLAVLKQELEEGQAERKRLEEGLTK